MKGLLVFGIALVGASAFGDQLWDNGPMATGSLNSDGEAAPAGNQWSEIQHVAGVNNTSISFGVNYTITTGFGPNRLSDDFTITDTPWAIDSIVVYGTQTNMSTSGSFLTGVVQIWNGRPGDAGSAVVAGDLTTNRLTSTAFTGLWRVGWGSNSVNRPIMAATMSLPVTLGPGSYWIEYGMTGSGAGSVQSPLVTVPGALTVPGANSRFFTSFQYFDLVDSGSGVPLAVPFQVIGTPVPEPCSLAAVGLGVVALVRRRRSRK